MDFEKKYWSEKEYTRKTGDAYKGYVGINDSEAYILDNEELLNKGDAWETHVNTSHYYYDRILDQDMALPHTREEIQYSANDFLTSTTLRNILIKLQNNNNYLFRNAIISNTKLPATEDCKILANNGQNGYLHTFSFKDHKTTTSLDPTFYPQKNKDGSSTKPPYDFTELVHTDMTITRVEGTSKADTRILHLLIFLVFKTKVAIFKYQYYQGVAGTPPDVNFNTGSTDVVVMDCVDPGAKNSLKFLGLNDIELHGNYMYLVDSKLNMVLRYDIGYLLHDESDLRFNVKSIRLIDNLSGDGSSIDRTYFKTPAAIAADDNFIYVADSGNLCIKKYTASFDYVSTIRSVVSTNHFIGSIAINPYAPTLDDGTVLEPGSLWVFSTNDEALYLSIISNDERVYYTRIHGISLLKDNYTWDEVFKSAKFSFTNSNYYYLSTSKRVFKLHISRPAYPFASLNYFRQRRSLTTMVWSLVPFPWHELPAGENGDENITWAYRPSNTAAEVLDNRGFCLCGVDAFVPTKENAQTYEQFNGDLIFHIGNLYNQQKVDTYIERNDCTFDNIPTADLKEMIKCAGFFLYIEPATYIKSISDSLVPSFQEDDLRFISKDEYVTPLTFNAHIYKVVYNLTVLKNILIGRFQGAYNVDNIMEFDELIQDDFFKNLKNQNDYNFYVYGNEPLSIMVNRIFEDIWDLQNKILDHMKAKFVSTPSANTSVTFRVI